MRVLFAAAFCLMGLTGCTTPAPLNDDSFSLGVTGAPTDANGPFTFTVTASGAPTVTSDHLGAHYWNATQEDPQAAFGLSKGCAHTSGDLPGTFDVTCNLEPGTWYVRAHARVVDGQDTFNYWGQEFEVIVHAV